MKKIVWRDSLKVTLLAGLFTCLTGTTNVNAQTVGGLQDGCRIQPTQLVKKDYDSRESWKKLKGQLTFYMANDLGRNGYYDQKPIASMMAMGMMTMSMTAATIDAPDINSAMMGSRRGSITDATDHQVLPGASIVIEDLHTGATSDVNGFYTLTNLKPGTYKVKVSYVGYAPKTYTIKLSGNTVERDIQLDGGSELSEVVVNGAFYGQRKALQMQKENMGVTNVVSADQVGKFPDSNIGDALKRINGVNVQYDQGGARFGQVRGTSADLTSVTVNGNRMPSAEGDTRNVQLDLIPADMIQTIELNKVVTSDMDGDAIGGEINLVTKNTPSSL